MAESRIYLWRERHPSPTSRPSIAVLAGGGAGGGGSGNGAGNGNGNGPGSGNGSGDAAQGDGQGAGSCGPGSPGGCGNCGHNVAAGDPIDVGSGSVFTVPRRDLFLPGPFNLDLKRSYSSQLRREDFGLGHGWMHSLSWRIEEHRLHAVVWSGDGKRTIIPRIEREGDESFSAGWGVRRANGVYTIRPGNEFVHWFKEREPKSGVWDLFAVTFRKRGIVRLEHDRGRLMGIVDAAGRAIACDSDDKGRLVSVRVSAPQVGGIVFARFAYDSEGNLVSFANADGHITSFAYDDDHLLTRIEYPSGLHVHFRYGDPVGAERRCIESWCDLPRKVDPALAADLPSMLADGVTPAKGILHVKMTYEQDGYTEVADSRGIYRYSSSEDGKIGRAVDARGGVMTRALDDDGRIIAQTDANGAVTNFQYDDLGERLREMSPDGSSVTIRRDAGGRPIEYVDPAGGTVTLARDPAGEVVSVTDQKGALTRISVDARGLPTEVFDDRGGRARYEYDAHGNATRYVTATGGRSSRSPPAAGGRSPSSGTRAARPFGATSRRAARSSHPSTRTTA